DRARRLRRSARRRGWRGSARRGRGRRPGGGVQPRRGDQRPRPRGRPRVLPLARLRVGLRPLPEAAALVSLDTRVEDFWRRFVAATGIDGPYTPWGFGNSERMMTDLALLVRDGPKRATASLPSEYAADEPLPRPSDLSVILD